MTMLVATSAFAAWVDPALEKQLRDAAAESELNVFITLDDQVDLVALVEELQDRHVSLARRHYEVITALQDKAAETQGELLALVDTAKKAGRVGKVKAFWITNAIAISARPAFIEELKKRSDIRSLYLDYDIELIEPVGEPIITPVDMGKSKGIENGILVSRAPELWALGIDGTGALACDQDTGADGNHPAFATRWRGLDTGVDPSEAWFDPVSGQTFPTDSGYHGTHTLGTILGEDGDNQIGMAPGAKWIGAKTIDVPGGNIFSDAVEAFEWSADPDGDPGTMEDVPDVVNNSWGLSQSYYGSCRDDFNASIDAAEAAGVVVVFAAGNEGSGSQTLRSPGNRIASDLNTFAIGALNQDNETAASFSSRGPSDCDGSTIKPEISAVGVDVRSSYPNNSYGVLSGTSMATPHVAGAVLLLRSAFPEATPEDVKLALYMSAEDLGTTGEDNTFGRGRMDVVEAYYWLMDYLVSSDGKVTLTQDGYNCDATITIKVADIDLTGATVNVTIASDSEPTGEIVTLTETSNEGIYQGTIDTATGTTSPNGQLEVDDADTIVVTYIDADDGNGNYNVAKTDDAVTDCQAPTFAGLVSITPGDYEATLEWNPATDVNPLHYNVYRTENSGVYNFLTPLFVATASPFVDETVVNNETYYYIVRAEDSYGNEEKNTIELSVTPVGPVRIFQDDFESDTLDQWTIVNGGTCSGTWQDDNPEGRSSPYLNGTFAIADRQAYMFGQMDEQLITPAIDLSDYVDIELRYTHEFDHEFLEKADVDYSLDGETWVRIVRYNNSDENEVVHELPALDHQPEVYIRFHYVNAGVMADFWGVDNVEITGWEEPLDDDTTDDDTTDDDTADDDTTDDDTTDDDTGDDDTGDDDTDDDDTDDDDTDDDDTGDDDVTDDDVTDDDATDDDVTDDDDDDDDDDGCGC